jgi:hypothetical protein
MISKGYRKVKFHSEKQSAAHCAKRAVECTGLPALHDDEKVLRRSFQQLAVGERIAVQQQEVGERVPFDHTELAQIGLRGPDMSSNPALSGIAILQPRSG